MPPFRSSFSAVAGFRETVLGKFGIVTNDSHARHNGSGQLLRRAGLLIVHGVNSHPSAHVPIIESTPWPNARWPRSTIRIARPTIIRVAWLVSDRIHELLRRRFRIHRSIGAALDGKCDRDQIRPP